MRSLQFDERTFFLVLISDVAHSMTREAAQFYPATPELPPIPSLTAQICACTWYKFRHSAVMDSGAIYLQLTQGSSPSTPIEGAWKMESYVRQADSVGITGLLLMTSGRWSTLYFVPDATGEYWGSAESGRYTRHNDQLTFHHEFTFQGGAGKRLLIDLDANRFESCRILLTQESLQIEFPSGNLIRCRRHVE